MSPPDDDETLRGFSAIAPRQAPPANAAVGVHGGAVDARGAHPPQRLRPGGRPRRRLRDVAELHGVALEGLNPEIIAVLEGMDEEIGRQHDAVLAAEARIAFLEQERDQDPLTPLLNRRAILADIAQLQRLDQAEQRRSSVILVDIPAWETSMAALARERREALLDRLGQALLGAVGLNPAARIAGARFAVLAVGLTGEKALALAHDCARALARPLVGTGDLRLPEPELGLIALPREGEAEEILARAEAALRPRAGVKR